MRSRKRKIVLLGAEGYERAGEGSRVECFSWAKINKIKNLRDYDTLIINLLCLENEEIRKKVSWASFFNLLGFDDARDILRHGGEIIVVGDPRFRVRVELRNGESKEKGEEEQEFLSWTGITYQWDCEPGDTVHFLDDYGHRQYEEYIKKIVKWEYSLSKCEIDQSKFGLYWNLEYFDKEDRRLVIERDFFCYNRYKNALAFSIRYQIWEKDKHYGNWENTVSFGPMIFLPKISLNEDETLQIVLRDICGIETSLPEPEWVSKLTAPGQRRIDEEIRLIRGELQNAMGKLDDAEERKVEARKCLKLLYEREYALEPIVRDILRGFGAHVEDPSEPNKEDGWLVVKVKDNKYEGVLEIKSTKSDQFDESGRKQLLDWVDRGRTLRGKNYKGIFVGNSAVDKPFEERPWAFSDSWTKAAELSRICAMKTEDLYVIHLLNARGIIDIDKFWEEIFTTNGVFEMKRYWELLAPKEGSDGKEQGRA